jgi:hypothetical protein
MNYFDLLHSLSSNVVLRGARGVPRTRFGFNGSLEGHITRQRRRNRREPMETIRAEAGTKSWPWHRHEDHIDPGKSILEGRAIRSALIKTAPLSLRPRSRSRIML